MAKFEIGKSRRLGVVCCNLCAFWFGFSSQEITLSILCVCESTSMKGVLISSIYETHVFHSVNNALSCDCGSMGLS
jgi:hypothetical protein